MILAVNPFAALLGVGIIVVLFFLLIALVVAILYLLTLQNTLRKIAPQNRTIEPGNVWLMLIPLFNLIYAFILYPKISESLKNEFESRGNPQGGDYLNTLGYVNAASGVTNLVLNFIPLIGSVIQLGLFVVWIVYWVQISSLKNKL